MRRNNSLEAWAAPTPDPACDAAFDRFLSRVRAATTAAQVIAAMRTAEVALASCKWGDPSVLCDGQALRTLVLACKQRRTAVPGMWSMQVAQALGRVLKLLPTPSVRSPAVV